MNRFTSDTNIMDSKLPKILTDCLEGPAIMVNLIITICIFNPWIIIPSLVQLIILIIWYNFCSPVIMSIRQLGLSNKSPIFSFFQSTISGISQMRIYNQLDNFTLKMDTHCENHFRSCNHLSKKFKNLFTIFLLLNLYIQLYSTGISEEFLQVT